MLYHFFIRQMNRMNSSSDFVTMMVPLTSSTYYYYYYYVYYYYYYYSTVTVFKLHGSGRLVVVTPQPPFGLIRTVMLVWRNGNINKTVSVLQPSIVDRA